MRFFEKLLVYSQLLLIQTFCRLLICSNSELVFTLHYHFSYCKIKTLFLQLTLSDQHPPVFSHCQGILNITMGKNGPVPFNYSLPFATDNSGVPPIMSYHPADIFRQPYLLQNQVRVINRAPALGILTFSTFDIKIRDLLVLWMFVEA